MKYWRSKRSTAAIFYPNIQTAEARAEEERRRADQAEAHAKKADMRVEEERQRSARYAAKLRELGVEVDDDL